jgi:hypothetical protein
MWISDSVRQTACRREVDTLGRALNVADTCENPVRSLVIRLSNRRLNSVLGNRMQRNQFQATALVLFPDFAQSAHLSLAAMFTSCASPRFGHLRRAAEQPDSVRYSCLAPLGWGDRACSNAAEMLRLVQRKEAAIFE